MYCVIQEVELKKQNTNGHYKELEVYKSSIWFDGSEKKCEYGYRYTGGRFERPIRKAYKISLHQSYREDERVKKKQYSVCTISYYNLLEFSLYDCASGRIERLSEKLEMKEDDIYNLIYLKLDPLIKKIEKEYQQTEEYKTHEKHKEIIDKYQEEKRKFKNEYGSDSYDYYYDVFGVLREPKKFEAFKKQYEASKTYQNSYYDNFKSNYNNYNFNNINSISKGNNYTDKEKGYLKTIYRAGAIKLHPDVIKDDGEGMKFLNKLKEEWGI